MTKLLDLPKSLEERRQLELFDDFTGVPAKQVHTYLLSNLSAGADLSATVIFQPGQRIYVHNVYIMGDGSAAGIDDSNTSVWTVANGATTIVAKTYNATTTFPVDSTQESLGTCAANVVAADGRIELTVTNGAAADPPATVVSIVYTPLDGYPNESWKLIPTDHGIATISDGVKGILALTPSDGTAGDNDEIYLTSRYELGKFLLNKPILIEAKLQFSEANTDDANVAFGMVDAVAANTIVDDGAGLDTSCDGFAIYKVDGGTVWKCFSSKATTQTISTSTKTAGGSAYQTLRIQVQPISSTYAEITFLVDGAPLLDSSTNRPIVHTLDYSSSPTEFQLFAGLKNGGTNAETLNVDYMGFFQLR